MEFKILAFFSALASCLILTCFDIQGEESYGQSNKTNNTNLTQGIPLQSTVTWKTYENPTYGIIIKYPSDWKFEDQDADIDKAIYRAGDYSGMSAIVDFDSPPNQNAEYGTLSLNFYNIPSGTTLEEFVQDELDDDAKSKTVLGINSPGWKVLDRTKMTVSNTPAEKTVSTRTFEGTESDLITAGEQRKYAVYTVINNKVYSLESNSSLL